MERIVVGVDGSAGSLAALRWALKLASETGAVLEVINVWELSYAWIDGYVPDVDRWEAQRGAQPAARRVVVVAPRPRPVPRPSGRYVQVEGEAPEVVDRSVRGGREHELGGGVPAVQEGETGAGVAEAHGPVDPAVVLLEHGPAPGQAHGELVVPDDLLHRVVREGREEQRSQAGEQRLLGQSGRPVGGADGGE